MLSLKTKTLSLPHLSLSRNSSPSRSHPPTPSTGPVSPVLVDRSTSTSPQHYALDPSVEQPPAPAPAQPKPSRRSSIGASLSALTSRSSSPAAGAPAPSTAPLKSPSLPSNLALTPAAPTAATASAPGSLGGARPHRSSSDDKSALRPQRSGRSTSAVASSSSKKQRSKSSDRAVEVAQLAAAASSSSMGPPAPAPAAAAAAKAKKPGLMASFGRGRGLALGSSQSQPGTSRATATAVRANSLGPDVALGGGSGAFGSGGAPASRSPVLGATPLAHSGAATPVTAVGGLAGAHGHAHALGSHANVSAKGQNVQLHQLAESYVGKVGLRLGEAVNKVFLPVPTGPGGIVDKAADKAEGPFGGHAVVCKGRAAPRLARAKEVGELITAELQAASHDPYLLRTLLRSSVLKALSLFLTRLSALLLVASPTDPALAPTLFAAPRTIKDADSLSIPLRFNLQIVRCAYEVKHALRLVAEPGGGFPHFVDETLKPWRVKLAELINRVMGPFVQSARLAVGDVCARARTEGAVGSSGEPLAAGAAAAAAAAAASSSLGLHGVAHPVPPPLKTSATSQLRSLSLGRTAPQHLAVSTPVTGPSGGVLSPSAAAAAAAAATAGPPWLRDLSAQLDAVVRVVARLEGGSDADKWVVSVATAASWKGMLHLSARAVGVVGGSATASTGGEAVEKGSSAAGTGEKALPAPAHQLPVRRGLLGGVGIKKTPSPPQSPPLPAADLVGPRASGAAGPSTAAARAPSAADIAFVRLLSDLELLEARLKAFLVAGLSTPATVLAPSTTAAAAPSSCPASSRNTGCGLCRTGRTFDDESSDSSSDDDDEGERDGGARRPDPSRESRLALSAMREAMQALSAMVVVVRASKDLGVLGRAIEGPRHVAAAAVSSDAQARLTPSALFALQAAPATPSAGLSTPNGAAAPLSSQCPTLLSALVTLPPILLLHLIAARLSPSPSSSSSSSSVASTLRLPHELWALRGGWDEYASELRGFAAAEEWELEVAAEFAAEAERVLALRGEHDKERGAATRAADDEREREALEALRAAARRTAGAPQGA
ncbi:hypothetical protein JCM9279_005849 [Rhodotorula babjevae]